MTIVWTKGLVVAVGTSSAALASIPVGARKAGIDGNLLNFKGKSLREKF